MPLLSATGGVADHICANCGAETHLLTADWIVADLDDSVISTPPCVCGSTESFSWHDWTYVDKDGNPDPSHAGAEQMVLIARVASATGRTRRSIGEPGRAYAQAPKAPTQTSVRDMVAKMRGQA
jgi:hypothetical protein